MAINPLDLLTDLYLSTEVSINDAVPELEEVHKYNRPYSSEPMAGGDLYIFEDEFINKVITAMSTDSMEGFTADEIELWNRLVTLGSQAEDYEPTDAERPELALDALLMALVDCKDTGTRPNTEEVADVFPCAE